MLAGKSNLTVRLGYVLATLWANAIKTLTIINPIMWHIASSWISVKLLDFELILSHL